MCIFEIAPAERGVFRESVSHIFFSEGNANKFEGLADGSGRYIIARVDEGKESLSTRVATVCLRPRGTMGKVQRALRITNPRRVIVYYLGKRRLFSLCYGPPIPGILKYDNQTYKIRWKSLFSGYVGVQDRFEIKLSALPRGSRVTVYINSVEWTWIALGVAYHLWYQGWTTGRG